jgi:hypothetical protein
VVTKVKVAQVRLCHSRMLFVRDYPRESQEMVFDAHEKAFAFFKGTCRRGIVVIGVGMGSSPTPPSEPYGRFSRIRLSSRWFLHRDCLAVTQAALSANSPSFAK